MRETYLMDFKNEYSYDIDKCNTVTCHVIVCCRQHNDVLFPVCLANFDCLLDLVSPFTELAFFGETSAMFSEALGSAATGVDAMIRTAPDSVGFYQIFPGSSSGFIT